MNIPRHVRHEFTAAPAASSNNRCYLYTVCSGKGKPDSVFKTCQRLSVGRSLSNITITAKKQRREEEREGKNAKVCKE